MGARLELEAGNLKRKLILPSFKKTILILILTGLVVLMRTYSLMIKLSLMMLQNVLITKAKMCQCLYSPVLCSGSLGRAVPEQAGLASGGLVENARQLRLESDCLVWWRYCTHQKLTDRSHGPWSHGSMVQSIVT